MLTKIKSFVILTVLVSLGGCDLAAPGETNDGFQAGAGDTFGTLHGEEGDFSIRQNQEGELSTIESIDEDTGQIEDVISLPQGDIPLQIDTSDGSMTLEFDADSIVLSVTNDSELAALFGEGDLVVQVGWDKLESLSNISTAQEEDNCAWNRDFLDYLCNLFSDLELESVIQAVVDHYAQEGVGDLFPEEVVSDFLNKYFDSIIRFCDSWQDYRDSGGDPCAE